jgi:hypothetical protein
MKRKEKLPFDPKVFLSKVNGGKKVRTQNDDQKTGVDIVRKALSWPARQIVINAGEDGSVIIGKILEKDTMGNHTAETRWLAGGPGFEPRLTESEWVAYPLQSTP